MPGISFAKKETGAIQCQVAAEVKRAPHVSIITCTSGSGDVSI